MTQKTTKEERDTICRRAANGEACTLLAAEFGVSVSAISALLRRRRIPVSSIKDLSGQQFGGLRVISLHGSRTSSGGARWVCECVCGAKVTIASTTLCSGRAVSCGCKKRRLRVDTPQANILYRRCQYWAKRRGLEFRLSFQAFLAKAQQPCHYCGTLPRQFAVPGRRDGRESGYSGIDRVDSTTGYTDENTVPCCKICNIAKRDLQVSEFREWVRRIGRTLESQQW